LKRYIVMVNNSSHSPDDLPILKGHEKFHLCMGGKRVVGAKFMELVFNEGRNPKRVPLVERPGKLDKS